MIGWDVVGSASGIEPSGSSGRIATISSQTLARPKSVILSVPCSVTRRLPGLMSRWQCSPWRNACSIPTQNW